MLCADDRPVLTELAPMLRRAVSLEPDVVVRLCLGGGRGTGYLMLPFDVLVARGISCAPRTPELDTTVRAADALSWLDGPGPAPSAMDAFWRTGLPPSRGWERLESVADGVVRDLVRRGAIAVKDLAGVQALPSGQAGPQAGAALLDTTVLSIEHPAGPVEVRLRSFSALVRMGFAPRGGEVHIDRAGRWLRVVGGYGTVFQAHGAALTLL